MSTANQPAILHATCVVRHVHAMRMLCSSGACKQQPFVSPGQRTQSWRRTVDLPRPSSTNKRRLSRCSMAVAASTADGGSSQHELLIVGPGVLGSYAGKLWKDSFPDSTVIGQTNGTDKHDRIKQMGLVPRTKDQADTAQRFPYVLFSAPPQSSADYPGEVHSAIKLWDGTGSFVFTSSASVCVPDSNDMVTEHCQAVDMGVRPNSDKLLAAEQAVMEGSKFHTASTYHPEMHGIISVAKAGGNVVRLAGLYHRYRGPHTVFMKLGGTVNRPGVHSINFIHYEDAARLAVAILRGDGSNDQQPYRSQLFLGCDNSPTTFQDMMDACFESGLLPGSISFTGTPDSTTPTKQLNNDATRRALGGWTPKYSSFRDFCFSGGQDFYASSGLF